MDRASTIQIKSFSSPPKKYKNRSCMNLVYTKIVCTKLKLKSWLSQGKNEKYELIVNEILRKYVQ